MFVYSSGAFAEPRDGLKLAHTIREAGGAGPLLLVAPGGIDAVSYIGDNTWGARMPRLTAMGEANLADLEQWRRVLIQARARIRMLRT